MNVIDPMICNVEIARNTISREDAGLTIFGVSGSVHSNVLSQTIVPIQITVGENQALVVQNNTVILHLMI